MKLTTPETRLNNMYKQMVLSTLSNLIKNPGTTWTMPEHCPMLPEAIWPWEFSAVANALDCLGYYQDVRPCLQYFAEHSRASADWEEYCARRRGEPPAWALSRAICSG